MTGGAFVKISNIAFLYRRYQVIFQIINNRLFILMCHCNRGLVFRFDRGFCVILRRVMTDITRIQRQCDCKFAVLAQSAALYHFDNFFCFFRLSYFKYIFINKSLRFQVIIYTAE